MFVMVVPGKMPEPLTVWPIDRPAVLETPVTVVLPPVKSPLKLIAVPVLEAEVTPLNALPALVRVMPLTVKLAALPVRDPPPLPVLPVIVNVGESSPDEDSGGTRFY